VARAGDSLVAAYPPVISSRIIMLRAGQYCNGTYMIRARPGLARGQQGSAFPVKPQG
jgi:hypothetical protein